MPIAPQELVAHLDPLVSDPRRLAAVHSIALLDSPTEETFDSMSRLAVNLVGAPASFLSIVDAERDFYKSAHGFPQELASAREVHGRTFCHYAIASTDPLVIEDTHADPLWRAVPIVDSLDVRAYVGVPLIVDGQPIGSFCVIDNQPRSWTDTEIETLVQLAKAAAREIQLRSALKESEANAERAHALAKANEELLAVVAHDLRSPLQVMGLNTSLLTRAGHAPSLPAIRRIEGAITSMKRLVDDLLSTHAVDSRERTLCETIAPARLLADAADAMGMVAERAGIHLHLVPGQAGEVFVDYAQLLRVLCNLIGNCLKYCPAGSTVSLGATETEDSIVIRVTDDGPGMGEAEQSCAFERGWQGSAGVAGQDGAGLGLWIVRTLVEQNQGRVALHSAPGQGTEVAVRLPRHRA